MEKKSLDKKIKNLYNNNDTKLYALIIFGKNKIRYLPHSKVSILVLFPAFNLVRF